MPKELPLNGIRVLEWTTNWAGPFACRLLADLGAEVIKVESTQKYDGARGPRVGQSGVGGYPQGIGGEAPYNRRGIFIRLNYNKLALAVNLKSQEGKRILTELIRRSDVIVENFSRRAVRELGLNYESISNIKPDIIHVSLSGFGADGPESEYLSYGLIQEATSGLCDLNGYVGENEVPMKTGADYSDPVSGVTAAGLMLAALHYKLLTGKGTSIDLSQCECVTACLGEIALDYSMNKRLQKRKGNKHSFMAPHGCYRCQGEDSWVTIAIASDKEWKALCACLGRPEWTTDPRFKDYLSRLQHQEELDKLIGSWTMCHDQHEAMEELQKFKVAAGAVLSSKGRVENKHLNSRRFFNEAYHREIGGTYVYPRPPMVLDGIPLPIRHLSPALGEHNHFILSKILQYSDAEIKELEEKGVIGTIALPGADSYT